MQTLNERRKYWGDNFVELEISGIQHAIDLVESIDIEREVHDREDNVKIRMIKKRKEDIEKLYEYMVGKYSELGEK